MKCARILALAILATITSTVRVRADDAPATQPAPASILVLPFEMLSNTVDNNWISDAVQQSLATEVARDPAVQVVTSKAPATLDIDAAGKAAKDAGATIVAFGSFQTTDTDVRITGYLMDVPTGRIFSAIKTSGPIRQLFTLEDRLDEQLNRALADRLPEVAAHLAASPGNVITIGATPATATAVQPPPAQNPPPQIPAAQEPLQPVNYGTLPPVIYYANPPAQTSIYNDNYATADYYPDYPQLGTYYYPNYNYGYGYGLGYGYPFFFTYGNFHGFHDHHDHFHNGGGGNFPFPGHHMPTFPDQAPGQPRHAFTPIMPQSNFGPTGRSTTIGGHR
jgi:TolB-like protein